MPWWIRTRNHSKRAAEDPRLRLREHWDITPVLHEQFLRNESDCDDTRIFICDLELTLLHIRLDYCDPGHFPLTKDS